MKQTLLIFSFYAITSYSFTQNVNFKWAKQLAGPNGTVGVTSIVADQLGNVYTAGRFSGTVDFDPGPGSFNLSTIPYNSDTSTSFISKLDSNGNFLWAKKFGPNAFSSSICYYEGSLYVAGGFTGTVDVDPGPAVNNLSTNILGSFICKFSASGNLIWATSLPGNPEGTGAESIVSDGMGNIVVGGQFTGIQDFDPGPGVFNLDAGYMSSYISKFDTIGNFVWAIAPQGSNGLVGNAFLATDNVGNIYCTGDFLGTVDFGGIALSAPALWANWDIYVWKINSTGGSVWAKQMGGLGPDGGHSIGVDAAQNIYIRGYFSGIADFDPGPGVYDLTSSNGNVANYLSKLDANGNFVWAEKAAGGFGGKIPIDNAGNLYLAGAFVGTTDFDPGPAVYNLTAVSSRYDMYILKLNSAGNFLWVKQIGGPGLGCSGMTTIDNSNIYAAGHFDGTVDFDPNAGVYNLTSAGPPVNQNIVSSGFVHKMTVCINTTYSTLNVIDCKPYQLNGQIYDSSGVYVQTILNSAGCDSIITLNLTINRIYTPFSASSCNPYSWQGHVYNASGDYRDTIITSSGCDSIVTLHLTMLPRSYSTILQSICVGQSYDGHTATGTYIDTLVAVNGCDSIRMLELTVEPQPSPNLGADTVLCEEDLLKLFPGVFDSYLWHDGSTQNHFSVNKAGVYSVIVSNNCGTASDQILITNKSCNIYFPSAFTPNNDGRNDLFKILGITSLAEYNLRIYNRWGGIVYETKDPKKGWDGNFKTIPQPVGMYTWFCRFKRKASDTLSTMKGTMVLVR